MFGRLGHGAATAIIAGVLCFAVPAAPANADGGPAGALLTMVAAAGGGEGLTLVAPYIEPIIAPVCSTGVGCAVLAGGVAIAIGLIATHDTWIPWIKNSFGGPGSIFSGAACGTVWCVDWVTQPVAGAVSQGFELQFYAVGNQNGTSPAGGIVMQCQTTAGVTYNDNTSFAGSSGHYPFFMFPPFTTGGIGASYNLVLTGCEDHGGVPGSITGIEFSGPVGDPTAPGANGLTWGAVAPLPDSGIRVSNQVDCVNPDGSTYEVTQGVNGLDGGMAPMPTCTGAPQAQPGAHGRCVTTSAGPIGGLMAVQSSDCPAIAAAEDANKALYPNCVGGVVACTYVIRIDGRPCTIGAADCQNWPALAETNPERVDCYYGPYSVALAACAPLERAYEEANRPVAGVGGLPATGPNTDGDPRTYTAPDPVIHPPTSPRVAPDPLPNPAPAPDPGPIPGGASPIAPTVGADCFPSGYGVFNPATWVLMPIECALKWAFVPAPGALAGPLSDFGDTWRSKPPGSLVVGATTVFGSIGSGWSGGCGSAASASFSQPELGHPLQLPCSPSGGGAGSVAYTAMQIALIVATLIGLWHMVAAGISAQATGGGD